LRALKKSYNEDVKLDANYGGVVWTKHALERLKERGLTQGEVYRAFRKPQTSRWAKSKRGIKYIRVDKNREVEVVAKKEESPSASSGFKWVILSCWSRRVKLDKKVKGDRVKRDKSRQGWLGKVVGWLVGRMGEKQH
jgi:hypothetical protein